LTPDLSVEIAGLKLKNPVMTASGTFGFGEEYAELVDVSRLGAVVTKSVTLQPWQGNPPPRVYETPSGMLNAIGLQNPGLEAVIVEKLPALGEFGVPVIVSIAGEAVAEYVELVARLSESEYVSALELNVSCPNVKRGGMQFGVDAELTRELVTQVREATALPLITKLSPNVTDIVPIAQAAAAGGSDALALINTLLAMSIDVEAARPRLGNVTGGLSGPAIRPVAVRMVWEVAQAVDLPLIGMGGIMTASDALEFILAGATAVAVGTGTFVTPTTALEVIEGIEEYCTRHDVARIRELVGKAQRDCKGGTHGN